MNIMKNKIIASVVAFTVLTPHAAAPAEAQSVVPAVAQVEAQTVVGDEVAQNVDLTPLIGILTAAGLLAVLGVVLAALSPGATGSDFGSINTNTQKPAEPTKQVNHERVTLPSTISTPTQTRENLSQPIVPEEPQGISAKQASVKIFNQINDYRRANGLPLLTWDTSHYRGGMAWSDSMAAAGQLQHDPSNNNRWVENVAMTAKTDPTESDGIASQWINSPAHNSILLNNNIRYAAVSVSKGTFYQNGRTFEAWYATFRATDNQFYG